MAKSINWTKEMEKKLLKLRGKGMSYVKLGRQFCLSQATIQRKLRELEGGEVRKKALSKMDIPEYKGPKFEEQKESILERYQGKYKKGDKLKWRGKKRKIKEVSKCFLVLDGDYPITVHFITDLYAEDCRNDWNGC